MNGTGIAPTLTEVITVEGRIGENVYKIMADCQELARFKHCIVQTEINGKKFRINEFTPLWIMIKEYEGR